MSLPKTVENKLDYVFQNRELLEKALTHRSFTHDRGNEDLLSNERLEYLGDAVIDLVVGKILFLEYKGDQEGDLSRKRASLVNASNLASLCLRLELQDHLRLGKSETLARVIERPRLLASLYEALIGAIFVDAGYDRTAAIVECHFRPFLVGRESISDFDTDFKTTFQEVVQRDRKLTPTYKLLNQEGPEHSKVFTVGLYIGDVFVQEGRGRSKKLAEQEAAKLALESWKS